MITVTADDVRESIKDDLAAIRESIEYIDGMLHRVIEVDDLRVARMRETDKRLLRQLDELPAKIAAHSPFVDRADILACASDEVMNIVGQIDEGLKLFRGKEP